MPTGYMPEDSLREGSLLYKEAGVGLADGRCDETASSSLIHDEWYMAMALQEAHKALFKCEVPVGAVVVGPEGEVLACGHNEKEGLHDPTAHAELRVLSAAARSLGDWRLSRCTLYVTKEPCVMCSGVILGARVARLVYGCRDVKGGAVQSLYTLLSDSRLNHQVAVVSGVREAECAGLLRRFFAGLRREKKLRHDKC